MIGLWDNTDCVMALPFTAWSRGNGRTNQNVGEMPAYPGGSLNSTFTNMAAGYGYVFGGAGNGAGLCNFDGVDDLLATELDIVLTNASKHTWEYKVHHISTTKGRWCVKYVDGDNYLLMGVNASEKPVLFFKIGTTIKKALSDGVLSDDTDYIIQFVKDGATLKIYQDGSEVPAYDTQDAYNLGNYTFSDVSIGEDPTGSISGPMSDRLHWFAYYNDAISQARITANAALGNDMGMLGLNTTDTMKLVTGVPVRRQVPGQISGQLAGQF